MGQYEARRNRFNQTRDDGITGLTESYRRSNGYAYTHILLPWQLDVTLGVSLDSYRSPKISDHVQANPKLGIMWNPTPDTTVRMAAFRNLNWARNEYASIEPTQVAGFNQLYYDPTGTSFWRYGFGIDHKLDNNLMMGGEASYRALAAQPLFDTPSDQYERWREESYRAYLNWAMAEQWSVALNYHLDKFRSDFQGNVTPLLAYFPTTETHTPSLSLRFFHPYGFWAQLEPMYVAQIAHGFDLGNWQEQKKQNNFFLMDLSMGYRLPQKLGMIKFQIRNLFDQHFSYQSEFWRMNNNGLDLAPQFYPARTITGQIILSF